MGFLQLAKLLDDTSVDMGREIEMLQGLIHTIHILGILEAVGNGTANSPIVCTGLMGMVCTNAAGIGTFIRMALLLELHGGMDLLQQCTLLGWNRPPSTVYRWAWRDQTGGQGGTDMPIGERGDALSPQAAVEGPEADLECGYGELVG